MGGEGKPELSREWLRRMTEMEMEMERKEQLVKEWVMCSTCCGFVWRKKRRAMMPNPHPGEVEEMLTDANKMRAAVMLMPKLPLVDEEVMEPDAATKNQLEILLMRRMMMMEHKRCPTCHRSVSDTPETKPCEEDKMVAPDETMAADDAGSNKKKNKRSMEEGKNKRSEGKNKKKKRSEGKNKNKRSMEEPKMVASEGEAMVADLGSREDSGCSMGRTWKSSSESNECSMGRTWKSSSESNEYSMGLTGKCSSESRVTGKSSSEGSEYSMGRTRKRRTKMVTCRLSKEFVQDYIRTHPRVRPFAHSTSSHIQRLFAHHIAEYEVKCEVHADWLSQCDIKGYVEYQEEVTDDEDNVVE
jgi:hypothetical protein